MTPAAILALVVQYGPSILPLIQELVQMVEEKKETVTAADLAELIALGSKSSADYLAAAGGPPKPP